MFSGLEKSIVNRVLRPSTVVERLEDWRRNYCLIDGIVNHQGIMSMPGQGGKVFESANNDYFTKEIRAMAIAQLTDDFRTARLVKKQRNGP